MNDADPTRHAILRLKRTCIPRAAGASCATTAAIQKIRADIRIIERRIEDLERENHRLITQADPRLERMWADVEGYQAAADRAGHGTSWRRMWEERTAGAAREAHRRASGKPAKSACEGIWHCLRALERSAEAVQETGELALGVMKDIKQAKEDKP